MCIYSGIQKSPAATPFVVVVDPAGEEREEGGRDYKVRTPVRTDQPFPFPNTMLESQRETNPKPRISAHCFKRLAVHKGKKEITPTYLGFPNAKIVQRSTAHWSLTLTDTINQPIIYHYIPPLLHSGGWLEEEGKSKYGLRHIH